MGRRSNNSILCQDFGKLEEKFGNVRTDDK